MSGDEYQKQRRGWGAAASAHSKDEWDKRSDGREEVGAGRLERERQQPQNE
jgi:hypothetical protein